MAARVSRVVIVLFLSAFVALLAWSMGPLPALSGESTQGIVVAYGNALDPPFVFKREDGVLTLNGYPFLPRAIPPKDVTHAAPAEVHEALAPVAREFRRLRSAAHGQMALAPTPSAAIDSAVAVFRGSSLVSNAEPRPRGVLVTFVGIDAPMDVNLSHALVRFEDADAACAIPEGQRMTNREGQEREVLLGAVEMGGLYAFGYGYTMVSRADEARLISAFLRGTRTDEDPKVAGFLRDNPWLAKDLRSPVPLDGLRASRHVSTRDE